MSEEKHDQEECHALTGKYHCEQCGRCCDYIGCPDCDPDYEENLAKEMGVWDKKN